MFDMDKMVQKRVIGHNPVCLLCQTTSDLSDNGSYDIREFR